MNWNKRMANLMRAILRKRRLFSITLVFWVTNIVLMGFTQAQTITGTVKDLDGTPLIGATVMVKGTSNGAVTDADGKYTLTVTEKDKVLVFSYVSMMSEEVEIGGQTTINMTLVQDIKSLNEVIVIGYGTAQRKDVTGSISSLKSGDFSKGTITSAEQIMQGKLAGVQIISESGAPGAGVRIKMRGVGSVSAGSDPLYVIDGVPAGYGGSHNSALGNVSNLSLNPMSTINIADIESIVIEKDASAAAIYGSRAANGVVFITTKSALKGNKISYDVTLGYSTPATKYKLLNAQEFLAKANEIGFTVTDGKANTDWQDQITRNALTQTHNLAFSGGKENFNYYTSFGYSSEDGLIKNNSMERFMFKLKLTQKLLHDKLTLDADFSKSRMNYKNIFNDNQRTDDRTKGVIWNALAYNPTQPVYAPPGSLSEKYGLVYNEVEVGSRGSVQNPLAMVMNNNDDSKFHNAKVIGSAKLEPIKGMSLTFRTSYSENSDERFIFIPSSNVTFVNASNGKPRTQGGEADQYWGKSDHSLYELFYNLDKSIAKHTVNFVLGGSYEYNFYQSLTVSRQDQLFDETNYYAIESGAPDPSRELGSDAGEDKMASAFGRLNYNYAGKYYFTGTLRADASSRFGANHRVGYFPSFALAWRLDEEQFIKNINFFDILKFRVGYGTLGNQEIPNYLWSELLYKSSVSVPLGNTTYQIINRAQSSNPDLKWESTTTYNLGLDFSFLKNRLSGTFELYKRKTKDMLFFASLRPETNPTATTNQLQNIGKMENDGMEFSLDGHIIDTKDWQVSLSGNISYNKNKMTKLATPEDIYYGAVTGTGMTGYTSSILRVGESVHSFYGYRFAGLTADGEETFYNSKNEVVTSSLVNDSAKTIIGSADPKFTYGITLSLRYKNIDLTAFFRGVKGVSVFNNTAFDLGRTLNQQEGRNLIVQTQAGESISAPIRRFSDQYIEDGSYLRFQNLTIGYTLPALKHISKLRVFVSGQNLFLISKYSGPDPELSAGDASWLGTFGTQNVDYAVYPRARTYTIGLNVEF